METVENENVLVGQAFSDATTRAAGVDPNGISCGVFSEKSALSGKNRIWAAQSGFRAAKAVVVEFFEAIFGGKASFGFHRRLWKSLGEFSLFTDFGLGCPHVHNPKITRDFWNFPCRRQVFGKFHKEFYKGLCKTPLFPHRFQQVVENSVDYPQVLWETW